MKKQFITAQELASILGISTANAYVRIKEMNAELKEKGFHVIDGKIPVKKAEECYYGIDFGLEDVNANN